MTDLEISLEEWLAEQRAEEEAQLPAEERDHDWTEDSQ